MENKLTPAPTGVTTEEITARINKLTLHEEMMVSNNIDTPFCKVTRVIDGLIYSYWGSHTGGITVTTQFVPYDGFND